MKLDKKLKFNFPIVENKISFKYKQLKEMDHFEIFIVVVLLELKKENRFFTVQNIFKNVLNIRSDQLIRVFWLPLIRKLIDKGVLKLINNENIDNDVDLLNLEIKLLDIHEKIENNIEKNKFYSLDDLEKNKDVFVYLGKEILGDYFQNYFNELDVEDGKSMYSNKNYNVFSPEELKSKVIKSYNELNKEDDIAITKTKIADDTNIKNAFIESYFGLEIDLLQNNILNIHINSNDKRQEYFLEDFLKVNAILESNNYQKIIDQIFPNNNYLKNIYQENNLIKCDTDIKNIIEFTNQTDLEKLENWVIYNKQLCNINRYNTWLFIKDKRINEQNLCVFVPNVIDDGEYDQVIEILYKDNKFNHKDFIEKLDLKVHLVRFLKKQAKKNLKSNPEEFIKTVEFISGMKQNPQLLIDIFGEQNIVEAFNNIELLSTFNKYKEQIFPFLNKFNIEDKIINSQNINMNIFKFVNSIDDKLIRKIFINKIDEIYSKTSIKEKFFETTFGLKLNQIILNEFDNYKKNIVEIDLDSMSENEYRTILTNLIAIDNISIFGIKKAKDYYSEIAIFVNEQKEKLENKIKFIKIYINFESTELRKKIESYLNRDEKNKTKALKKIDLRLAEWYKFLSGLMHYDVASDATNFKEIDKQKLLENYHKLNKLKSEFEEYKKRK